MKTVPASPLKSQILNMKFILGIICIGAFLAVLLAPNNYLHDSFLICFGIFIGWLVTFLCYFWRECKQAVESDPKSKSGDIMEGCITPVSDGSPLIKVCAWCDSSAGKHPNQTHGICPKCAKTHFPSYDLTPIPSHNS